MMFEKSRWQFYLLEFKSVVCATLAVVHSIRMYP